MRRAYEIAKTASFWLLVVVGWVVIMEKVATWLLR